MKIMLCHINICVTHNILDGLNVHTQCLHLGNKGMPAAMWRQHADTINLLQRLFELVSEVGRIAGLILPAGLPNKLLLRVPGASG